MCRQILIDDDANLRASLSEALAEQEALVAMPLPGVTRCGRQAR
jgi:hypothetical protein